MKRYVGIDVGKYTLDMYVDEQHVSFKNTKQGIEKLINYLRPKENCFVLVEATGGYEQAVREALQAALICVYVAHPNHVRNFAKSKGYLAKTDKLDAKMLCEYGAQNQLMTASKPLSAQQQQIKNLLTRREQLVEEKISEENRLDKSLDNFTKASIVRHVSWLKEEIQRIEKEMKQMLAKDEVLKARVELYQSVDGVGWLTSLTLFALLPELAETEPKKISALVGVAPMNQDSGRKRGHRKVKGGRGSVRRILYMAALSAIRCNQEIKQFYQRLRKDGKAGKLALTAAMRKLLVMLNAVARRGTPWKKKLAVGVAAL
jgi:transposase